MCSVLSLRNMIPGKHLFAQVRIGVKTPEKVVL